MSNQQQIRLKTEEQTSVKSTIVHELSNKLSQRMDLVNHAILEEMHSDVPLIPELARYLIAAGGKRIRPLLTLAAAHISGYTNDLSDKTKVNDVLLAAVVEFIHTATLLHDDVVDESTLRRGKASANVTFGNQASVLVGDFLFSRAFQLMVRAGDLNILGTLSQASATIAEGEVMQLSAIGDLDMTRQTYFDVIGAKTAALFAAATEVGARLSGELTEAQINAFRDYGDALGCAFQIADDCLDYDPKNRDLGKNIGDDFREGKVTLPVILTLEKASETERGQWKKWFEAGDQSDEDLEKAIDMILRHNAIERSQEIAQSYVEQAQQALAILPDHPWKDMLSELVVFAAFRKK